MHSVYNCISVYSSKFVFQCTVTCGEGTTLRDAVCMKKLPGGILAVVSNDNCIPEDKPEVAKACQRPACREEWYMTDWSQVRRRHLLVAQI